MADEIISNLVDSLLISDDGFECRPFCPEFLFSDDLFVLGDFFKLLVDERFYLLIHPDIDDTAFVIDWNGSLVFDGLLDIIDADIFTKDVPRDFILKVDGCPGKSDK